jgi:hypothetical protein
MSGARWGRERERWVKDRAGRESERWGEDRGGMGEI